MRKISISIFFAMMALMLWNVGCDKVKPWDKTFGGNGYDIAFSLIQTTDGGYAMAGETSSKGAGKGDLWLVKVDKNGNL